MRLCLVLHAHLPYVRHPEHPEFLEEDWLYEAIAEVYVPLLDAFERLAEEGVPFRVTMTLTPTLCEMLADPLLRERSERWLRRRVELVDRARSRVGPEFVPALEAHARLFAKGPRDLLSGFRRLQEAGRIEILTCAATHAYLPNVLRPEARRAQIRVAIRNYEKHFGRRPRGIWLPECGYAPGIDRLLAEHRLEFFFVDAHAVPGHGRTPAGPRVFARDTASARQVWSATEGYPGDPWYREFYRDLGFDEDEAFLRPFVPDGLRRNLGIKLHRITGGVDLGAKKPYDPAAASARAGEHARHFHESLLSREGLIVAPFDAELFGHWWFEGPQFLEQLLRRCGASTATPADVDGSDLPVVEPALSSWGRNGYSEVWIDPANEWIYRHQHEAADRMIELAKDPPSRAMSQAGREFLLAQASDWAFLMSTGTAAAYAERRFRSHVDRFTRLRDQIRDGRIDEAYLAECEERDCIFPEIDVRDFIG